jgi:hypothetical protein
MLDPMSDSVIGIPNAQRGCLIDHRGKPDGENAFGFSVLD